MNDKRVATDAKQDLSEGRTVRTSIISPAFIAERGRALGARLQMQDQFGMVLSHAEVADRLNAWRNK
ncbi:MAG: hypothetical protein WCJ29_04855 [bacterium]